LLSKLAMNVPAPVTASDATRAAIRSMLREGGFKPSGRAKPASEYLLRAVGEGALDSINLAVDACNVVSLHSGIPISVVDLDRATPPFTVRLGEAGERYVFNASGQEMDLSGLLCLVDADGPCANAVKDSQRTKTSADTTRTLSILWGSRDIAVGVQAATAWYRELLAAAGASTTIIEPDTVQ
jgi:DNA/RNA-binding domain of Phe-tRNA-synthetase-like protein